MAQNKPADSGFARCGYQPASLSHPEYFPAAQSVHQDAPSVEDFPAAQSVQVVALPPPEYVPAEQEVHEGNGFEQYGAHSQQREQALGPQIESVYCG